MSHARTLLAVSLVVALSGSTARGGEAADANLATLRDTIRANKRALVAVNLQLTDEEAAKFWPVYDRYQKDLDAVRSRLVKVIEDYSAQFRNLSDEGGMKLVRDYLAVETDRAKVRQSYATPFAEALPGRKVARFYQIENKIDALLGYELSASIPVIEDDEGSPPAHP
jgi:hypothetical protein